jgi:malate synthase
MSAFIPSKKDAAVNDAAIKKIVEDKEREVKSGCDGSWVAHPDLVKVARSVFEKWMGAKLHQKNVMRHDVNVKDTDLTRLHIPGGKNI